MIALGIGVSTQRERTNHMIWALTRAFRNPNDKINSEQELSDGYHRKGSAEQLVLSRHGVYPGTLPNLSMECVFNQSERLDLNVITICARTVTTVV
jgi:hypothetical protein